MTTNVWARRRARRALVQAVYQWQLNQSDSRSIEAEFTGTAALKKADTDFFREVLQGVLHHCGELDEKIGPELDRALSSLDQVELAVLRLGAFELEHRIDVPYRAVIDEYVELTKVFGAQDGYKFVNGVLDKLARNLRQLETGSE